MHANRNPDRPRVRGDHRRGAAAGARRAGQEAGQNVASIQEVALPTFASER